MTGRRVDRVPFIKVFGGTNAIAPHWEAEYPGIGKCIDELLKFEGGYRGWQIAPVNMGLSALPGGEVIREDDGQVVRRHGDGSVTINRKHGDYHTQVIEWPVKTRRDWDRIKAEHMRPDDPARFPADWAEHVRRFKDRDFPLQLTHGGVYGFARRMLGDENLAYAFYDEPAMVHDIMDTYTEMAVAVWEKMTADVQFDLIECWEDMASKNGPLVSPRLFDEFMRPNYQRIAQFASSRGIEIILIDSDGNIEKLTEWMLAAGVTALYPYEVQAGNDVAAMLDKFPALGVISGLDKNAMAAGRDAIDREMERAAKLIAKGRFIPGPDHFVLSDVSFANYRYFMAQLRQVVLTTRPGSA